ncbi:hypothetical protein AB9K26_10990 [Psychroserpens sp. XS_ASV72]|uniref:hypothetical protein n=1 Tax=Psychroserpens sp. XS_ASV72 TaxID=3241293 RepID=UPI003514C3A9
MLFLACNDGNNTTENKKNDDVAESESTTISKKDIQSLKFTDYGLSFKAKDKVSNWQKYQELTNQIGFLKQADLSFYSSDVSLITTFLNDFKIEIPKELATNEILARITVLETKTLSLNSVLSLDNISKNEKLQAVKELLVSYSNLNLQINKKLEFDSNNISKPQ